MIEIREALTELEREAVYRLRYEIYVEEMNRPQVWADHAKRTIREPLDVYSRIFQGHEDGRLVGTIRATFAADGVLECESLYGLDSFPCVTREQISMTTKLMVRAEYRERSTLAARLAMFLFDYYVERGIRLDFIDTNFHLVPFYSKMGYRCYQRDIDHPEYGRVVPMVLTTDDVPYLEDIRSPFRRTARKQFGEGPYLGAEGFHQAMANGVRRDQASKKWVATLPHRTLAQVA